MGEARTVGIVGGGGAGLVSAQALLAAGVEPVVYEARDGIGGNWRYDPEPGRSSCYASLITNTSRWRTTLRSHRLPRTGRAHLRHDEMLAYLEEFTRRFDLDRRIRLGTEVVAARPVDGEWEVESAAGDRERHRALIVATGYNNVPLIPDWPGGFDGHLAHTHDYRTPEPYRDLDVLVVGLGCSATELACEIAGVARSVTLLARSGRNVIPHRIGPVPADATDTETSSRLPWSLRRRMIGGISRMTVGDLTKYGLPAPPERPADHPIAVTSELKGALRCGHIQGRTGAIARLAGDRAVLEDGDEIRADAILAGTGYRAEFPFLPPEADAPTIERAPLYRGIASLAIPGLFYVGIVGGHGALLPMFEAQANWVAAVLSGRIDLPDAGTMRSSIEADAKVRQRDFDPRWGFLFDRQRYVRAVTREANNGRTQERAGSPTYA